MSARGYPGESSKAKDKDLIDKAGTSVQELYPFSAPIVIPAKAGILILVIDSALDSRSSLSRVRHGIGNDS